MAEAEGSGVEKEWEDKGFEGNEATSCDKTNVTSSSMMEEDEEMDVEAEGSSLPTPVSSDLDQTPHSVTEADAEGEKIEKESSLCLPTSTTTNSGFTSNGPFMSFTTPNLTKRSVTLQMLLAAGILKPGDGTMSLEYHGQKFVGDLLENGQIRSQETSQIFSSPSAWATACKQIINPDKNQRKSGCGWASIKYRSLKLDYYKTVWFKRVREGSIDVRHISNGASSSSDDSDEDDASHCILKFGEHFDNSPSHISAQQTGAKVLISCTDFKEMERLQPFHVKVANEAMALADFHSNASSTESIGYISGQWNGDQNCLKMEMIHPCQILMSHSSGIDCDNERNRIALDIQRLGHEVVGWYHSHPRAPALPSKDDIMRQLDYQIMMKGASESSYIPCVGVIISPLCYSTQDNAKRSQVQFFWVMPPPENRPTEMGRPMQIKFETYSESNFDPNKLLLNMRVLLDFYKEKKDFVELNDVSIGNFQKLKDAVSSWITALRTDDEFWKDVKQLFCLSAPPSLPPIPVLPIEVNDPVVSASPNECELNEPQTGMELEKDETPTSMPMD